MSKANIERAIKTLRNKKPIVLRDNEKRENEGDLIFPAEIVTPSIINFMIQQCSGIVCLVLTSSHLKKLQLPLMVSEEENTNQYGTAFTISIEAKDGVYTGVSAEDRATTIQTAVKNDVKPEDLVRPGHVFPLKAKDNGVLEREGHTEGSIDIMRLAGFKPQAVLCELMNPDGTMMRGKELESFIKKYQLAMVTINDIIEYRKIINFNTE